MMGVGNWIFFLAIFIVSDIASSRESSWGNKRSFHGNQREYQDMRTRDEGRAMYRRRARVSRSRVNERQRSAKPNIIFVMTDDQDVMLGSMAYMPKTQRILGAGGANFENAFVTSPICCPSRSSILTGLYVHNHNVHTNNENCSSLMWREHYETRNFGTYLSNAGYRTGYFGKYLNEYEGDHIPPGWTEWVGLIRNTRFYNYSLNFNGKKIKHGDSYKDDYLTDLIANDSVAFLKQSKQFFPNRPVAMVLSMPAPHGPEDAAPQYQHLYPNASSHRTASWNFAPNPDKQWLLQYTGKMEPIHISFTDMLQRKRLQTLMSVDDAIEKMYTELRDLGELDNTYWLFSSDHGYHIGQYGLVKGKSMPYDFDTRVPFMMRGPNIPQGVRVQNIVLNVDIAPTLLDIAGVEIPEHMDGKSVLELFEQSEKPNSMNNGILKNKKAWRDTFLIERGKITKRKVLTREKLEAQKNLIIYSKQHRLESECTKGEYMPPCNGSQQWVCRRKEDGNLRIYKCRYGRKEENEVSPQSKCHCPELEGAGIMNRGEKKRQRQFLRDHVNQPKMLKPKFIRPKRRFRRSPFVGAPVANSTERSMDFPPIADAGPSHILSLPQRSVILDGTGSMDDNGIVGYQWTMVSPLRNVDMLGTRTPYLQVSNFEVGDYSFRLTVMDTIGQISSQTVHVIVKPAKASIGKVQLEPSTLPVDETLESSQEEISGDFASEPGPNPLEASYNYDSSQANSGLTASESQVVLNYEDSNYDEYSEYYFVDPDEMKTEEGSEKSSGSSGQTEPHGQVSCRVLPNDTVACEEEVYNSRHAWESEKQTLDEMIKKLKQELDQLKDMKKHLRDQRPLEKGSQVSSEVPPTEGTPLLDPSDHAPNIWPAQAGSIDYEYPDFDEGSLTSAEYADLLDYATPSNDYADLGMEDLLEEFLVEPPNDQKEEPCVCDDFVTLDPKRLHQLPANQSSFYEQSMSKKRRKSSPHKPTAQAVSSREQKWQIRQSKRDEKKQERDTRRQHKQVVREMKRELKREQKKGKKSSEVKEWETVHDPEDCHSKNMKCFSHSNEHWKTAPVWEPKWGARNDPQCRLPGLECTRMDNEHWKVLPHWTLGPFCFCPNSNNNTYWCLRTINETHNFLYCEFITGFISYYDMTKDPYQLRNAVYDLSYTSLQEMHVLLEKLKGCSGSRECTMRYRNEEEMEGQAKQKKQRRKTRARNERNSIVDPTNLDIPSWARRNRE